MNEERPSDRLVAQRSRNRLIEVLELTASFEDQEKLHEVVYAPYEVINSWEDWVRKSPQQTAEHLPLVSPAELEAMCSFHEAWETAADDLPNDFPPLPTVFARPAWQQLQLAASSALAVFLQRGKFSDDVEVGEDLT